MVGEPLATRAELEGIAVRLLADFPVQGIQPTAIVGNSDFVVDNPDVATGFVTAYLQACRDLTAGGYNDPAILAIIEEYTGVAASLAARAVKPVCFPNGEINAEGLRSLQTFFRGRGQLEYDEDIDPVTFIDTQYVDAALERLGPVEA
jgi:ABC-type nitrate/sulfonate/bicarbonate transport system substrate-binding protein